MSSAPTDPLATRGTVVPPRNAQLVVTAREVPGVQLRPLLHAVHLTPPAIVNNYGPQVHIYGRNGEQAAARFIRRAISGTSGDAIAERENHEQPQKPRN